MRIDTNSTNCKIIKQSKVQKGEGERLALLFDSSGNTSWAKGT